MNAKPMKRLYRKEQLITAYLFLLPLAVGIALFFAIPILQAFYYAFTEWKGLGKAVFIGFGNFRRMLNSDPRFINEVKNTLVFVIGTIPLTIFIALIIATLLNSGIRGVSAYRVIYFLPNITMLAVVVLIWKWLLNSQYGIVDTVLFTLFGIRPAWLADIKLTMITMCIIAIWAGVGYCIVIILAGLQGIDKTYYEAAKIDGANGIQQFFRITLPMITPTMFFLVVMRAIVAFNQFELVYLLSESGQQQGSAGPILRSLETLVYGVYKSGFQEFYMGYACAKAIVLFLIILAVTFIQFLGEKYWVNY